MFADGRARLARKGSPLADAGESRDGRPRVARFLPHKRRKQAHLNPGEAYGGDKTKEQREEVERPEVREGGFEARGKRSAAAEERKEQERPGREWRTGETS